MLVDELLFGLQITGIGIGVVFSALSLVALIISMFDRFGRETAPSPVQSQVLSAPEETGTDVILPEVIAVISAAVEVALGSKARVTHVRHTTVSGSWQQSGRATIMASHVTKR